MGKKSTLLYLLWRKRFWVKSYRIGQLWTIREKKLHYLPLQRSFEVTRGHQPSFANNFWSKRDRDVGLVSVRLSWPGESTDMQYDPFWSSRDLGLTWPEVKLWPWPFKVILYMVRRALTRQTRWYQIRCSIFKIKDFIVEKPFWKILEFWPLETPILTWAKKWPKMISKWFFASFRTLPFVFLYGDQEPRSWGGAFKRPPPPSRRWEIQRPSRARVNPMQMSSVHAVFGWFGVHPKTLFSRNIANSFTSSYSHSTNLTNSREISRNNVKCPERFVRLYSSIATDVRCYVISILSFNWK